MAQDTELTFGQRAADWAAANIGSWRFLILLNGFMASWMLFNTQTDFAFDPFPFILLNLCLSWLAGIQAPLIMISQNRQEEVQRNTLITILDIAKASRIMLREHKRHLEEMRAHDAEIASDLDDIKEELQDLTHKTQGE